jgi:hypothetical protein
MSMYRLPDGSKAVLTPAQERKAERFCLNNHYDMGDYLQSVISDKPLPARLTVECVAWTVFWVVAFLIVVGVLL